MEGSPFLWKGSRRIRGTSWARRCPLHHAPHGPPPRLRQGGRPFPPQPIRVTPVAQPGDRAMPRLGRGLFTAALAALSGVGAGATAGCSGGKAPEIRALGDTPQLAAYFDAASIERKGDTVRVTVITVYNPAAGGVQDAMLD